MAYLGVVVIVQMVIIGVYNKDNIILPGIFSAFTCVLRRWLWGGFISVWRGYAEGEYDFMLLIGCLYKSHHF